MWRESPQPPSMDGVVLIGRYAEQAFGVTKHRVRATSAWPDFINPLEASELSLFPSAPYTVVQN
jgi:hypothetical protein